MHENVSFIGIATSVNYFVQDGAQVIEILYAGNFKRLERHNYF